MAIDERVVEEVRGEARRLNPGDSLTDAALAAMARRAAQGLEFSVETGCGGSTLLLSHLSRRHVAFAIEGAHGSIARVRRSRYFNAGTTCFVEGPTQVTLPRYEFTQWIDLALIDGPHGFPFPQMEYYYLYPHLRPGALLIVDDIQVRSVHDLFRFLRADAMFRLVEQNGTTAFFERTGAPAFDPYGDGWWLQGYNARPLWRYRWRQGLKARLPAGVLRRWRSWRSGISIESPAEGERVGRVAVAGGRAAIPAGWLVWVFVHRADIAGWWPQGGSAAPGRRWEVACRFGEEVDAGYAFEIAAVALDVVRDRQLREWMEECDSRGEHPPIELPDGPAAIRTVFRLNVESR